MTSIKGTRWRERDSRFTQRIIEITNDVDAYANGFAEAVTIANPDSPLTVGKPLRMPIRVSNLRKRWVLVSEESQ